MKYSLSVIMLSLTLVAPCFAQGDFTVKEVRGAETVMQDAGTGSELLVQEGDNLGDGWTVITIEQDQVTIEKQVSPGRKVRAQLPVRTMQSLPATE